MAKTVKPQVEKFREVARELGCDESEERFDDALRKIGRSVPKDVHESVDKKGSDRGRDKK